MILKQIDDNKIKELETLKELLKISKDEKQKDKIRANIAKNESGIKGEKETAYLLDFALKDTENYAVLHDLRFEIDGQTAQIDHLIISRLDGIILLETKNTFSAEVTIKDDGSLVYRYPNNKRFTYANPLEQSKRHEIVLKKILDKYNNNTNLTSYVIFLPEVKITNSQLPDNYFRADSFVNEFRKNAIKPTAKNIFSVFGKIITNNIFSTKEITNLGNILIENHKPIKFDYREFYKIDSQLVVEQEEKKEEVVQIIKKRKTKVKKEVGPKKVEKVDTPTKLITIHSANSAKYSNIKEDGKYMGNDMISFKCNSCGAVQRKSLKVSKEKEIFCKKCGK